MLKEESTGIHYTHRIDTDHPQAYLYYTGYSGGSVNLADVNGDGKLDLYCAGGPDRNRLYLATDSQRYREVEEVPFHGKERWGTGANWVDIDSDGDLDLYQCYYDSPNELFLNNGDSQFVNVAKEAGVDVTDASTMASFVDVDNDGDLDIYLVCYQLLLPNGRPPSVPYVMKDGVPVTSPDFERYLMILPREDGRYSVRQYGRADYLFLNTGLNQQGIPEFRDITKAAGVHHYGYGHSPVWLDFDDDNDLDLYISNDFDVPDFFFRNDGINEAGIPQFQDITSETLPTVPWLSMGSDAADINRDGRPDLFGTDMAATTHFKQKVSMGRLRPAARKLLESGWPRQLMRNHMFINSGSGMFYETAYASGIASSDWTWSCRFGDLDNDGFQDLFITNGAMRNFTHADYSIRTSESLVGRTLWDRYKDKESMPEANLVFQNIDGYRFKKREDWGLGNL